MHYLDHAATTPLRPQALAAMQGCFGLFGNPSSVHGAGRAARLRLEDARDQLAASLGADPVEVIFTGGGTAADNLALKGIFWQRVASDPRCRRLVISPLEHPAVLEAARWLVSSQQAVLHELEVDRAGQVDPQQVEELLASYPGEVALVSIGWVNNEVGSVAPIAAFSQVCARFGVPLHVDAVQAVGHVPVDFAASGVSALSVAAHKLGGPHGVGALLLRRDHEVVPVLHGGGQERQVHSGTLNVVGAAGFAAAVAQAVADQPQEAVRLAGLRDALVRGVLAQVPDATLLGSPLGSPQRSCHVALLSFPACAGDLLLMGLDSHEVFASTGSACSAGVVRPSHVVQALGYDSATALSCLRFSLGWSSSLADIQAVPEVIAEVVAAARRAGLPPLGE